MIYGIPIAEITANPDKLRIIIRITTRAAEQSIIKPLLMTSDSECPIGIAVEAFFI
jgi:hypothetical protein